MISLKDQKADSEEEWEQEEEGEQESEPSIYHQDYHL